MIWKPFMGWKTLLFDISEKWNSKEENIKRFYKQTLCFLNIFVYDPSSHMWFKFMQITLAYVWIMRKVGYVFFHRHSRICFLPSLRIYQVWMDPFRGIVCIHNTWWFPTRDQNVRKFISFRCHRSERLWETHKPSIRKGFRFELKRVQSFTRVFAQ